MQPLTPVVSQLAFMIFICALRILPALLCFLFLRMPDGLSQRNKNKKSAHAEIYVKETEISIQKELASFDTDVPGAVYKITLCADVPNNKKPHKVAHNQQTGHVFLILQQMNPQRSDTISQVFGFYPKRGLPVLFFKRMKSVIKDNSKRFYDAAVSKTLTADEFDAVLQKARELAGYTYHINQFNCYDYALQIFNVAAADDPLALRYVKFPFIFGKGGSPVGVFQELKRLKSNGSAWSSSIVFGDFEAPKSTTRHLTAKDIKKVRNR